MQFGTRKIGLAIGVALCCLAAQHRPAPPPTPPPPATLWSFLGVPQGYRWFRDNAFNRNGDQQQVDEPAAA